MKLKIKTLNNKCLVIEIEETKTVYDLKKELALYPDIGVKPELQKLIYTGKILENEQKLSDCNIDDNKFLVIMVLKTPLLPPKDSGSQQPQTKSVEPSTPKKKEEKPKVAEETKSPPQKSTNSEAKFKTPTGQSGRTREALVKQIVEMGYPQSEVRRALAASFYNPERAIEYLIEGIPTSPSTPEGETCTDTDANLSMSPSEILRGNIGCIRLRSRLHQHPRLIGDFIRRIARTSPTLLSLFNENPQESLNTLIANDISHDDDNEGEEEEMDDDTEEHLDF